jgi:hypothetical protein
MDQGGTREQGMDGHRVVEIECHPELVFETGDRIAHRRRSPRWATAKPQMIQIQIKAAVVLGFPSRWETADRGWHQLRRRETSLWFLRTSS